LNKIKDEYSKYQEPFLLGRVISVHKTQYVCIVNEKQYYCNVSGRFKYLSYQKNDYPVVGDYVIFRPSEYDNSGIIEKVCSRYSSLSRVGVSKTGEEQLLATNIDIVFVCMSLNQDFNLRKLRRFLSLAYTSDAETIIVLTKADLVENIDSYIDKVRSIDLKSSIVVVSVEDRDSIERINHLVTNKTGVFLGSSGVGKSTIVNHLLNEEWFATKTIRESDAQGRHTTSHREMIALPNGGFVIDTPGIRMVYSYVVDDLESSYEQIMNASQYCKFQDCSHTNEPGCNVRKELDSGELNQEVFDSYQHTLRLNKHNAQRELARARLQNKRKKS
jgi:ribosome biogenesis GTPase